MVEVNKQKLAMSVRNETIFQTNVFMEITGVFELHFKIFYQLEEYYSEMSDDTYYP